MARNPFALWFERKFVEWEAEAGHRRTVSEFAEWLNIPRSLCSRYLTGSRSPSRKNVDLIAIRLGPEVYDLLGLQRPDEVLQRLQGVWDQLTETQKAGIVSILEESEASRSSPSRAFT